MSTQHSASLEWDLLDRLHKSMRVRGIGSSELAVQLGVHRNTVSNYLSGRTPVDRRTLIAWAFATGVSVDWLLGNEETPRPEPGGVSVRRQGFEPRTRYSMTIGGLTTGNVIQFPIRSAEAAAELATLATVTQIRSAS